MINNLPSITHRLRIRAVAWAAAIPVLLLPTHVIATDWSVMSDAEACLEAERIVIGEVVEPGARTGLVIRVWETLKGNHVDELSLAPTDSMGPVMFVTGNIGVFLLRENDQSLGAFAFNPACFQPLNKVSRIRDVLTMYSNPSKFAAHPGAACDLDVAHTLGYLFQGFAITSEEIPEVGLYLSRLVEPFFVMAPWEERYRVIQTYLHNPSRESPVELIAEDPAGALSDHLKERVMQALSPYHERIGPIREFRIHLDATNPMEIDGLTFVQAVAYLHCCLSAADDEIVMTALASLARIRDSSAVPHVIRLLGHESERVSVSAIHFLGWAGNPEAIGPLSDLLLSVSPYYPKQHSQANAVCRALARFEFQAARPALVVAAQHGVEFAGYVLGALGSTEDFPVILEIYLNNPQYSIAEGLHRLVQRSNRDAEPWMSNPTYTEEIGVRTMALWRSWWTENREGFEVVRSFVEARNLDATRLRRPAGEMKSDR